MSVGHSERAHALLSASGASRWLNCTPSARLEEQFPEGESSVFAQEGTLAHELSEAILRRKLNILTAAQYNKEVARIEAHELYTPDMPAEVEKYTDHVLECYAVAKKQKTDAILSIEEKVDFSDYVPEGFGTADAIIIADGTMHVIDLKYGKGVEVSAEDNPQAKLYAIGAYHKYSLAYDIHTVVLTIVQPRLNAVSVWEISTQDLLAWANDILVPKAKEAHDGEGKHVPGSWCRWCKAAGACRALAEANLETAKRAFEEDAKDHSVLSNAELSEVYMKLDDITKWANSVKDYMLAQATNGVSFPDLKLVEGRSVRKFADEEEVLSVLETIEGIEAEEYLNVKLGGIGQIEKLLGKKTFNEILSTHVIKPPGKPTLVHESDKRTAIGSADGATKAFENE